MSSYKKIPLGEVASYINGYAFKPIDWGKSGLPIIRIQNLTDENKEFNYYEGNFDKKYLIKRGDILISWSASLGIYEWNKSDAILNQHIFKVIFDKIQVDKKYYFFVLKKILREAIKNTHGSTMKHITRPQFEKILFPFYELEKQKKIAKILENISNIIEKKKQKLQEYELLSKCLFIKMFGDPILNEKKFKKGKIRDTIVEAKYGTSKPATIGGKYPYLRMNNITYNGELDLSDLKYITLEKNEEEKYLVEKGDILFNRTNSKELVGKTCVFNLNTPMVIAGYLIKLKVNKQVIPEYISAFLNSVHGKRRLREMCRNIIGQANINAQELQDISILIPPIELQNQFAERVKMIEKSKFYIQR